MSDREIVMRTWTTGDADWKTVTLKESDLIAEREEILREMEITHEEYRRIVDESCHQSCSRPEWSERFERWDRVKDIDDLLG